MLKSLRRPNPKYVVPVTAIIMLFAMMLTPLPDLGYLFGSLVNFMHIPVFAVLSLVVWILTGPLFVRKPVLKAFVVWLIVGFIGVFFEFLQYRSGRTASLHDVIANLLGSGMLLCFLLSTIVVKPRFQKVWRGISIACLLLALYTPLMEVYDVLRMRLDFPRIADFEARHEMNRWRSGNASFCRSDFFGVDSDYSMHIEFYPGEFSGVWIPYAVPDWSGYSKLVLHVSVPPKSEPIPLMLKLEDLHHNGTLEDRFQTEFNLEPGSHRLEISLDDVKLAHRKFDLSQVEMLQFMLWDQEDSHDIYVDAIHLE